LLAVVEVQHNMVVEEVLVDIRLQLYQFRQVLDTQLQSVAAVVVECTIKME
jgi:hypothetical protein